VVVKFQRREESDPENMEVYVAITSFRKHAGEKVLHDLFERMPKSKVADDLPAGDIGGVPMLEPGLINPSVPPDVPDRLRLV